MSGPPGSHGPRRVGRYRQVRSSQAGRCQGPKLEVVNTKNPAVAPGKTAARRRAAGSPPVTEVPVLRSGWPSGVALVDEESLSLLESLAEDPPEGSLVVLACEFADVALDAGDLVARGLLGAAAAEDFHPCSPEGERWTVGEVEQLASRVLRYPRYRHVLLVDGAETMERRALDRLLLLLEEPPTPLLVLLVVSRADALPATIRGRAALEIAIGVLPVLERVRALESRGVGAQVARESVELAGVRPSLAGPFAADATFREIARRALDPVQDPRPVTGTEERLVALATVASVLAAIRKDPSAPVQIENCGYEDLDPAGKSAFRELVVVWAEHRRRWLAGLLHDLPAQAAPVVERSFGDLDLLLERLRVPVSPSLAFAACAAASPRVEDVVRSRRR